MSDTGGPNVIDGFASVQAVRRAVPQAREPRFRDSITNVPGADAKPGQPVVPARHIGHSALPPRHDILCYECGYSFVLQGRLVKVLCPRCKTFLEYGDHTIAQEWSGTMKTIGMVSIIDGAVLKSGIVNAGGIVLDGIAEDCDLRTPGRIAIGPHARYDLARIKAQDFALRAGARLVLPEMFTCRNLEVEGTVNGVIHTLGALTIRSGGMVQGVVLCAHLVVEDGAGLSADVSAGAVEQAPSRRTG